MNRQLIMRIQELFAQKLQAKTGWGRNEVTALLKESINEAVLELLLDENKTE
jgi:hypothetical protein